MFAANVVSGSGFQKKITEKNWREFPQGGYPNVEGKNEQLRTYIKNARQKICIHIFSPPSFYVYIFFLVDLLGKNMET